MGAYDAVEIKFTVVISLLDRPCSLSARRRTGKTLYFVINLPVILLLYKLNLFLFQLSTKTIHHIRSFVTTDNREAIEWNSRNVRNNWFLLSGSHMVASHRI